MLRTDGAFAPTMWSMGIGFPCSVRMMAIAARDVDRGAKGPSPCPTARPRFYVNTPPIRLKLLFTGTEEACAGIDEPPPPRRAER